MHELDNQDIPYVRLKDIVNYLERELGRTSILVQRLDIPLRSEKGQSTSNAKVDNNQFVKVRSAEVPVFSTRKDLEIIPPLPELGSTEPLENIIADLNIYDRTPKLRLPNGVRLSYNDILTLAGNFYGIEDSICDPKGNPADKFIRAFNDLALQDPDVLQPQLDQLMAIMRIERNSVESVLGNGIGDPSIPTVLDDDLTYNDPSDMYKKHGLWFTKQYDAILGGEWGKKDGKVLKMGRHNLDHYQPYSLEVWRIGHELALARAKEAGIVYRTPGSGKIELGFAMLEEAYSMSAYSCNYLVESFTAGHIRVPVKKLRSDVGGFNGYKLGYYNFAEDEKFGLNVMNKLNDRWTCWGQKQFYDRFNNGHRERVAKVLQDVVAQIFTAFGDQAYEGDYGAILNQVPEPDTRMPNNYPLFRVADDGRLLRRCYFDDLSCTSTYDNWWGGTAVDMVKKYTPRNSVIRPPRATAQE